ncbi:CsbD family protein [Symbiopectobacterium sp. RP]|uniref:CsbD family protein n=1 Tax=Symbiopectobacterium sp. RP TaxID=3248553 RepID=UPI003D28219D
MNSDIVVGLWKQLRGNFWALWAEWFDSDCAWLESNNDYLAGILQQDYSLQEGDELSDTTVQAGKGSATLH